MADPVDPSEILTPEDVSQTKQGTEAIDDQTRALKEHADSTIDDKDATSSLSDAKDKATKVTKGLSKAYDEAKSGLVSYLQNVKDGTELTEAQGLAMAKMSAIVSDSNKIFANFGKDKVSTGFIDQYSKVSDLILKEIAPMLGKGSDAVNSVMQRLTGFKLPTSMMGATIEVVDKYIKTQLSAADAAMRLRDTILSNAVATGYYGEILDKSGSSLESINNLLENHNEIMINAAQATGATTEHVQEFYNELTRIPGGFDNVVNSGKGFNQSMLSAMITLSAGTRQSASDMSKIMNKVYQDYGVSDERALKFVARMSEASNNLKLPFEVTKSFMEGISEQVGMLGENIDASSDILNKYSNSFTGLGLSANQAQKLISGMTRSVLDMNIAQKAFLSAQSGGPGGLMGGFKIDKMIRDGKLNEVMDMVEKQMKKQFGKIVTLDDASKSPQAAAQLAKQTTLLKSGPLGKFAQNDAEAYRILEGLKTKDTSVLQKKELSQKPVQDFLAKGNLLQEKSLTIFSKMATGIDALNSRGATAQLNNIELTYSAGVNDKVAPNTPDLNAQVRQTLKESKLGAENKSSKLLEDIRDPKQYKGNQNFEAGIHMREMSNTFRNMKSTLVDAPINAGKMVFGNKKENHEDILNQKYQEQKTQPIKDVLNANYGSKKNDQILRIPEDKIVNTVPMKQEVENTSSFLTRRDEAANEKQKQNDHDVHVDVEIKGVCIDCGKKMQESANQRIKNTGTGASR